MEILKGFTWDIQRFATSVWTAGKTLYSVAATTAANATLDITKAADWDDDVTVSGAGAASTDVIRATIDASGVVTIAHGSTTGTPLVFTADSTAFTGTIGDATGAVAANLKFTGTRSYSIQFTNNNTNADITISSITTGDDIKLAAGKTLTIGSQVYKAKTAGAEIKEISGTAVLVAQDLDMSTVAKTASYTVATSAVGAAIDGTTTFKAGSVATSISSTPATGIVGLASGSDVTTTVMGLKIAADATSFKSGADSSESGKITINNVAYYAGRTTNSDATVAATFITDASLTTGAYLTAGTVYLDGSKSKSVSTNAGTPTTADIQTVTVVSGDISVDKTLGGALVVHDLDNGDSFTITSDEGTKTWTVVNGVLTNVTDNTAYTSATTAKVLGAGTEGTLSLQVTFVQGAIDVAGGGAITSEFNVYTSKGGTIGSTETVGINVGTNLTGATTVAVGSAYTKGTTYVHASGLVDTISSGAIGSMTYDSSKEVFTYNALKDANKVDLTGDTNKWVVNGGSNKDVIIGNGNESTLNGGAGNDTITAGANDYALGGAGNDSLYSAAATTGATLSGGAGNDTLWAGNADATLTGGEGANVFMLSNAAGTNAGNGTVSDYKVSEDFVYVADTVANIRDEVATRTNFSTDGSFHLNTVAGGNAGTLKFNATNGMYAVNVKGNDNKSQLFGWVGDEATKIDASGYKNSVIIVGDTNTAGDSLYGGSGDDSIYGGSGDSVYGGAGKNQIALTTPVAGDDTRTVGIGTGKDTVTGFAAGFDGDSADKLYLVGNMSTIASTLAGGQLNLKSGDAAVELQGLATAASGGVEILAGDKKALFAASGATVTVDSASYADYYYGTKTNGIGSFLDGSSIEDAISVDLSNTSVFKNITQVTGGQGMTSLIGGTDNETLIAGAGNTSLYGGAGKDSLVGNSAAKDTFFMLAGAGSDSVNGFTYFNGENADTADIVNLSAVSSAKLVAGGVQINVNDTDKALIEGATADNAIGYQIGGGNVGAAKIGSVGASNSFTYLNGVNYYGGGTKVDTLAFASGDSDNHQVWLDGSHGVTYSSIDVVDGSSASGDLILAGDSAKNTIVGGAGNNSLWGGVGNSVDTLRGGSSANTFYYGLAEGNDVIECGSESDVVNLYNIALADVKSAAITSSAVSVEFVDGSNLTVNTGYRDVKFNLASGETYTANHNTQKWE